MPATKKIARRYVIRGHVQGVGYRAFARAHASAIGVTGTVRNLDDGSVEVIAQGTKSQLDTLAGHLHQGPRYGTVIGVAESEHSLISARDFDVRY